MPCFPEIAALGILDHHHGLLLDAKGQGVKEAMIVKVEGNHFKFVEYLRPPEK
jgi:hypothetical protein